MVFIRTCTAMSVLMCYKSGMLAFEIPEQSPTSAAGALSCEELSPAAASQYWDLLSRLGHLKAVILTTLDFQARLPTSCYPIC